MNVTSVSRYRGNNEVAIWVCNNSEFLGSRLITNLRKKSQRGPRQANLRIIPKKSVLITDFYHQKYTFMFGFKLKNLFVINTYALISEEPHTCCSRAVYGSPLGPSSVCFFEVRSCVAFLFFFCSVFRANNSCRCLNSLSESAPEESGSPPAWSLGGPCPGASDTSTNELFSAKSCFENSSRRFLVSEFIGSFSGDCEGM